MEHRILAAETRYTKGQMLYDDAHCLTVDEVTVCECVFEHSYHRVNVVSGLRADVFEHEGQCFETTGPYIELRSTVFIENRRNTRKSWKAMSAYGNHSQA